MSSQLNSREKQAKDALETARQLVECLAHDRDVVMLNAERMSRILGTANARIAELEAKLRQAEAAQKPEPEPKAPEGFALNGEDRLPKKGEAYLRHDGCVSWAVEDHVPGNQVRRILLKLPDLHPDDKPVAARMGYRVTGEYRPVRYGEFYVDPTTGRVYGPGLPINDTKRFIAERVGPV